MGFTYMLSLKSNKNFAIINSKTCKNGDVAPLITINDGVQLSTINYYLFS